MNRLFVGLLVLGLVLVGGVTAGLVGAPEFSDYLGANAEELNETRAERLIHTTTNDERRATGADSVSFDAAIARVARAHSEDMAQQGYYSHTGPDGNDHSDRLDEAGVDCGSSGENIMRTWYQTRVAGPNGEELSYDTNSELATGVVNEWLNSSDHRTNLLLPEWEREGIGVATTTDEEGRPLVYVTQVFC